MPQRIAYTKSGKTVEELIVHLDRKGLAIPDREQVATSLGRVGYYRLLIYMRPLQVAQTRSFIRGVAFDDILALYDFDRRLRLICLDAIERIEVALRAAITSAVVPGSDAGPHFYLDARHFSNPQKHTRFVQIANDPKTRRQQPVEHYFQTYNAPSHPPIWALLEATTFGDVSHLFAGLNLAHRKKISSQLGYDEKVLINWFASINILRNVCAHHGRLWNKNNLVHVPRVAKALRAEFSIEPGRVAGRAVTLVALLNEIDPHSDWKHRFKALINNRPHQAFAKARLTTAVMGFAPGWETRRFWN